MDDLIARADEHEEREQIMSEINQDLEDERLAGLAKQKEDDHYKEHGTRATCLGCGVTGIMETDFADYYPSDSTGWCNICIKKGPR